MRQINIYSLDFLRQEKLKCVPGLRFEDSEFTLRAIYLAKRIIPLHEPFYNYRIRQGSITTSPESAKRNLIARANVLRSNFAFYAKVSADASFKPEITSLWIKFWLKIILLKWFNPHYVKNVPRSNRIDTLKIMFEDGFADIAKLMRRGRGLDRIAFSLIRAFITIPFARTPVEKFFDVF